MYLITAHEKGHFTPELAPFEVKVKKGKEMFSSDEHPRATTLEKLASLPPVFKEKGTVSAGNASVSAVIATLKEIKKYVLIFGIYPKCFG